MSGSSTGLFFRRFGKYGSALLCASILASSPGPARAQGDSAGEPTPEKVASDLFGKLTPDSKKGEYAEIVAAIKEFKKAKLDETRKLLAAAKAKNPKLPPPDMMLVRLLLAVNQPQPARAELEKCVLDNPSDPEAYLFMADIAVQQREITAADLLLHEAERLAAKFDESPERLKDFKIRINAGEAAVAEAREQWPEAQKRLAAWIAADPTTAAGYQRLGGVLVHMGKFADAYTNLEKATTLDDKMINANAALGLMCQQAAARFNTEKDADQATALKKEAAARMTKAFVEIRNAKSDAKSKDKTLRALLAIADFYLVTADLARAKVVSEAALALDPRSVEAKIQRGIVARFEKDSATAEKYLTEAWQMSPDSFMATNHLAIVLAEDGKNQEKLQRAAEFAVANVKQYPKNPEAAATYGWVLYKAGDRLNASKALEAAASSGSLSADSAYYAAVILNDIGKKADAIRLLEAASKTATPFFHKEAAEKLLSELRPKEDSEKSKDASVSPKK
ncbi:MAG TPA: tetratricopeptide repeat protein [Pirellulales bacterium]|jgi:predicted Zn-dependent protease|nr:tetratricopeptide repeat protein [Pirellulales bacterium]